MLGNQLSVRMIYNSDLADKVNAYFQVELGLSPYRNGWLKGNCPECGKYKFGANIHRNRINCFSCGLSGNAKKFIMAREGFTTFGQLWVFLKAYENSVYLEPQEKLPKTHYETKDSITLPTHFSLVGMGDSLYDKIVSSYLKSRGLKLSTLVGLGWGYCYAGPYKGRIIIPYYTSGKLVYYTARKLLTDGAKFKNASSEEVGIGKSLLVYNIDALALYDKIWVVESAINAVTIGDNATGYGGKSLSNFQIGQILKSPCTRVVIALDPDAMKEAYALGLRLARYKKVKILKLPEGEDVNSLGKAKVKLLERNTPYMSYQEIYRLKLYEKG